MTQTPRNILITGASSGIGAALALIYAAPGTRLFLHGRSAERLSGIQQQAETKGASVIIGTGDIRDAAAVAEWIKSCDRQAPLDLVIANAGVSLGTGSAAANGAQNTVVFDTNLTGVLNSIEPVLPLFLQRRGGQIAIISSLASFRGFAGAAAYCASKAAVRVYGEALRSECLPRGVRVNVVCPGFVRTPMTDVNPFRMPFIMTAEHAAAIIRRGLEQDRPRIAFPPVMYALVRILTALPQSWLDLLLRGSPRKGG